MGCSARNAELAGYLLPSQSNPGAVFPVPSHPCMYTEEVTWTSAWSAGRVGAVSEAGFPSLSSR